MTEVTRERAERAVQFLVDNAHAYGEARADVARAEAMLRHVKALAMKASDEASAAAQEREAYASEDYKQAIIDLFEATKRAEILKGQIEAAKCLIEYWRSLNATQRAAERGYGSAA